MAVTEKYGRTENVFFSNSCASVRTVKRATFMCFHLPSIFSNTSSTFCSQISPLKAYSKTLALYLIYSLKFLNNPVYKSSFQGRYEKVGIQINWILPKTIHR